MSANKSSAAQREGEICFVAYENAHLQRCQSIIKFRVPFPLRAERRKLFPSTAVKMTLRNSDIHESAAVTMLKMRSRLVPSSSRTSRLNSFVCTIDGVNRCETRSLVVVYISRAPRAKSFHVFTNKNFPSSTWNLAPRTSFQAIRWEIDAPMENGSQRRYRRYSRRFIV